MRAREKGSRSSDSGGNGVCDSVVVQGKPRQEVESDEDKGSKNPENG